MTRSSKLLSVLLAFALVPVAAVAGGKEKVKLVRKTRKGDRLAVKESQRTETTSHWKGEGEGAVNGQEVEVVERDYLQEVLKESPLTLRRDYKSSTRTKGKPSEDKPEPVRTSVHGKTVVLSPDGPKVEGGELSKEDRDNLDTLERIAYACLPKDEVGPGDTWKISDEIGRALFGPGFDPENVKSQGTGKLDSVKTVDGRRAARLVLKVSLEVKATEVIPSIVLDLKGTATFLVEEGVFTELQLEGPGRIEAKDTKDGKKRTMTAETATVYHLKAAIAAAAPEAPPPKPLAKDDELARAEAVQCSKGHKFPNRFQFCAQCGKEIDPKTQRCGGGCAPLLRFCPLCGEGLVPAK